MSLQPSLKAARVDGAYNLSLMTMRQARQRAVDERKTYIVTLVAPRTIQVSRQDGAVPPNPAPPPVLVNTYVLAQDVSFNNEPGIPTTSTGTPDGFGVGSFAIDLNVDNGGGANRCTSVLTGGHTTNLAESTTVCFISAGPANC